MRSTDRPNGPVGEAGGAGRLEDARRQLRAAFDDGARLELVLQPQLERRGLAAPRVVVQRPEIAMQRGAHLVDRGRRLGADELHERVLG
jgi:hypothetical protein